VRKLIKYFLLGLVLLLVSLSSALLAMRFAIHGREVRVPKLERLTPAEAERIANAQGLMLAVENRFYSSDVPAGLIVSQSPAPNTKVRRGWKLRVAESLGPQRAAIPNVVGQSERVAELNITRRGLQIGTVAAIHYPGTQPLTVIAQNPGPDTNASSPKINLLITTPDNTQTYVMPNFVNQPLAEATATIKQAGFTLGKVDLVDDPSGPSGIILHQTPAAGQKITAAGTAINLVVRK
jgi:beta-lactam-binding protein with PASTA domain